MIKHLALVLLAMVGMACSGLGNIEKPKVNLSNVRMEDVSLFETTMVFKIRVTNDNPFPLTIDGGSHEFYLNGTYIGKGSSKEVVTIGKFDSALQDVVVHLSNLSMISKIQSLLDNQKLDYRIDSKIYVDRGFGSHSVSASESGELNLDSRERSTKSTMTKAAIESTIATALGSTQGS